MHKKVLCLHEFLCPTLYHYRSSRSVGAKLWCSAAIPSKFLVFCILNTNDACLRTDVLFEKSRSSLSLRSTHRNPGLLVLPLLLLAFLGEPSAVFVGSYYSVWPVILRLNSSNRTVEHKSEAPHLSKSCSVIAQSPTFCPSRWCCLDVGWHTRSSEYDLLISEANQYPKIFCICTELDHLQHNESLRNV